MKTDSIYDVIIIGSGPAGLTAGIYASRAELSTLVIAGSKPGGQLTDTTEVENFPGFPEGIQGPELMEKMTRQAARFGARIVPETVKAVNFKSRPFEAQTDGNVYHGRTVIITAGAGAKWLGLGNEQRLRGHGVSACATCDGFFFKGKEVAVAGGGDAAMEEALFLTKFASRVTVVHRRNELRASKIMQAQAKANPKIAFELNAEITDVLGKDKVEGVRLRNLTTGQEQDYKVEGLFVAVGHEPNTQIFSDQLELDVKGYIKVENHTRTSVPGVFSAGDVSDHRYRQAITAAGYGCMAAMDAEKWLSKEKG